VGLVKLMGRHSGFIAAHASLANADVNFCLVPEVPFGLEGERGFLAALRKRLEEKHHAVVVVAEGAGQDLLEQAPAERDASGNIKLGDIGVLLRDEIRRHFAQHDIPVDVKYIDPSYIPPTPWTPSSASCWDRMQSTPEWPAARTWWWDSGIGTSHTCPSRWPWLPGSNWIRRGPSGREY
jgi:6-phosphofructokinase 1